jgi:hypothetical protein
MNCNFEIYCSNLIHEVEFLSPLKALKNNDKIQFCEVWKLGEF